MASTFDPWTQNVTFHLRDGTPIEVPINIVDDWAQYPLRVCINYAAQLGASVVLLVILLLLTRAEKRASYVFALNCVALLLNFVRLLCSILVFTSAFARAYAYFSGDYSEVPRGAYANSVTGAIFAAILLTIIEVSLVLQVQVVCSNLRRIYRRALLTLSTVVALVPIGFRYWLAVVNIKNILDAASPVPTNWLESAANIVLTVSICFFCAVFVTKLGFAIRLRRKLGLTDFGPMKVIFVMGCQTLIIPAIFSIIHYSVDVPELSTNVLTLVTLSLPLSSLWAGTTLDKPGRSSSNGRNLWQILSFSGYKGRHSSAESSTTGKPCTQCYSDSRTLTEKDSKRTEGGVSEAFGISVEHDISVESARRESFELTHV
ncbi:fungal pheromone mating factor STE2 GPCR-domain-containing protein [Aspergillus karnatakaensis]|uniref:alpha-factor pheromone receptor STE2 n=1 Tax=Aspergillus karnatakaensis TaxID=1810916 RepID=UPI003CCCBEFF